MAGRITHGHCTGKRKENSTPTYRSWKAMKDRLRPSHPEHRYYAAVTICERWQKFENFLEDMGERPLGMTLERKDRLGNYMPDNCIWADRFTQNNNRRGNRKVLCGGRLMTTALAARELNIRHGTLWMRLRSLGWPEIDVAELHFVKYKTHQGIVTNELPHVSGST